MGSYDNTNEVAQGQARHNANRSNGQQDPRRIGAPAVKPKAVKKTWAPINVPPPSAAFLARKGALDDYGEKAAGYEPGGSYLKPSAVDNRMRVDFERQYGPQVGAYGGGEGGGYDSGGGYSGGGGGGGGGGSSAAEDAAKKAEQFAQLDALMATMTGAVSADQATAKTAFDGLDQYMQNLSNPYAQIGPAQQAQVDPSALSNLLLSQGGDDAGLRAQAQFLQAQNAAGAGASDRRAQMLRATQDAWNQSSRTGGQLAGQQVQGDLLSQLLGMKAAIESRKAAL